MQWPATRRRRAKILGELEERARVAFVSPYHIAYVYTGLGEFDRAMDSLERAVAERTGPAYSIKDRSVNATPCTSEIFVRCSSG